MRLGNCFYWCGWGCIIVSIFLLVIGFISGDVVIPAIFKAVVGFVMGGVFIKVGAKEILKAKLERIRQSGFKGNLEQFEEVQRLLGFREDNDCAGCRFCDKEAMWDGGKWCIRPEPPELSKDGSWCLSRERGD